jgi:hypothetical protein
MKITEIAVRHGRSETALLASQSTHQEIDRRKTINGGHFVILSKDPNADRAFFRDVLKLTHIDVGNGWLILGLPPAEIQHIHLSRIMCMNST